MANNFTELAVEVTEGGDKLKHRLKNVSFNTTFCLCIYIYASYKRQCYSTSFVCLGLFAERYAKVSGYDITTKR